MTSSNRLAAKRLMVLAGTAAAVTGLATIGLTQPAAAIGNEIFESSFGIFENPDRPDDDLAIECLQYGTGDPATFSPSPDPTTDPPPDPPSDYQTAGPDVLNQIRFGRIPDGVPFVGGTCSDDPGADTGFGSSGFGFAGTSTQNTVGDYFEMGRFFHFNRTIERGARYVELATTLSFFDPVTATSVPLSTTFEVALDETSDFVDGQPAGATYTVADCEYQTDTAGQDVPNRQESTPLGLATLCADQVQIQQSSPFQFVTIGATDITVDVAGFTSVDNSSECTTGVVEGNTIYTAEQNANPLCLLAQIVPGTLTIDKTLDSVDDGDFTFEFTEYDQAAGSLDQSTTQQTTVSTSGGSGSSGPIGLEPGLYALSEVNVPAGVAAGDFTCTTDGADATVVIDGVEYIDIDSTENVTCGITNTALIPAIDLVKTADAGEVELGDVINYSFVATNTGEVALSDVVIDDPLPNLSALECVPTQPAVLDLGESLQCTATYTTTDDDAAAEVVHNTASVTGTPISGTDVTDESNVDVQVVASEPTPTTTPPTTAPAPAPVEPTPTTMPAAAPTPAPLLPATGSGPGGLTLVAGAFLATGAVLILAGRRRTPASQPDAAER